MTLKEKIIKNIKNGTFFKNGYKYIYRRVRKKLKHNNLFISRDKYRLQLKNIYESLPKINSHFIKIGNYYASQEITLNSNSIIYSLGVGNHIDFDLDIVNKYNCPVFMFDPTPLSIEFMEGFKDNKLLIFSPIGVWTEKTNLTFFTPKYGGSASAINHLKEPSDSFIAECNTLEHFMKKNNHSRIDYLKMDIEGAALPIILNAFENKIFPSQIMTEFEAPSDRSDRVQEKYIRDVKKIISLAEKENYVIYALPYSGVKYYALELLFIKKD